MACSNKAQKVAGKSGEKNTFGGEGMENLDTDLSSLQIQGLKNTDMFEDVTDDGELKKRIIKQGRSRVPPVYARVWIRFESYVEECQQPYDETCSSEKFTFVLFNTAVLPVLEFGVASMLLREKAHFITTAKFAYGPIGVPKDLPSRATMVFIIELVDFMEQSSTVPIYKKLTMEESIELGFVEAKAAVERIKEKANECWRIGKYKIAHAGYYRSMYILQRPKDLSLNLNAERNKLLFAIFNNMAVCHLHSENYKAARYYCIKASELPPETLGNRCKLHYRLAKAELGLGHIEMSKDYCLKALKFEPSNKECLVLLDTLVDKIEADSRVSTALYKKMTADLKIPKKQEESDYQSSSPQEEAEDTEEDEDFDPNKLAAEMGIILEKPFRPVRIVVAGDETDEDDDDLDTSHQGNKKIIKKTWST